MRSALYAPLLSLISLCALAPQVNGHELCSEADGRTVLNADLWAAYGWFNTSPIPSIAVAARDGAQARQAPRIC